MVPAAAVARLSSAVSCSSGPCERLISLRRVGERRSTTTTAAVCDSAPPPPRKTSLRECAAGADTKSRRQLVDSLGLSNREPRSVAWGKWAGNMRPQGSAESKLEVRSIYEGTDESTEKAAKPASEDAVPDIRGGVIALGKFDALHAGHRALAEQAAKMGFPVLLSFSGMANVLGWEPRLPVAALCDRKRIMSLWANRCGGVIPRECALEFVKVRSLSPRDFVQKLSKDINVKGVVAGANYRFGYKAAGDASDLVQLCNEFGLQSFIVDPVMDKDEDKSSMNGELSGTREKGQISSTRIRKALEVGNTELVADLLGRKHRLVLKLDNCTEESARLIVPVRSALNQYPGEGRYQCTVVGTGEAANAAGGQDGGTSLADTLIGTAEVKIGPAWIEILLAGTDIAAVLQRKCLGLEF